MPVNRTQIARAIFSAAESMGISDRKLIERMIDQVIERTEQRSLPGMEDLVLDRNKAKYTPTVSEIQSMVKEILAQEEKSETNLSSQEKPESQQATLSTAKKESQPKMTTMAKPKAKSISDSSSGRKPANGINLTENALHVLEKRYLQKDKTGKPVEAPAELFRRVARTIAAADQAYNPNADVKAREEEFYRAMTSLDFLPNSPTLMNAGRELGQLSACFVLPVEDSMESIFDAVKYTALIHKSGGGTGFSFSRLRPEKDRVGSTGGIASGPVSFIRAFDTATDVIKQGGMRRGANMGILSVDHPDILRFITAKEDMVSLTNFNLSVAITRDFMEAVKAGTDYNLINPHNHEVFGKLNAQEVFDKIVNGAWKTGDPGVIFIDRINQDNPTPKLGKIESTNPCGEQPLLPYESCNLGSINLARMLKTNGKCDIDWPKLARTVHTAVRFLDNVIDVNQFPLPQIEKRTKETRKIGLGVMGFADMLLQLGIPYNSEEGLKAAEDIMHFIDDEALKASQELAAERGVFPAFEGSIYDVPNGPKVRNAARTTIAPTGTLSIIAGCSGGIEPVFALSFTKNILDGSHLIEVNPYFEECAKQGGFYSEELMQKLAEGAHLSEIEDIPEEVTEVYVTAHEIAPEWHIRMQAAFQKYTNNAVSKTVNFPKTATREDVANVYKMAYEAGLKGITIYRDGSRENQVLTTGKEKAAATAEPETSPAPVSRAPRQRAKITTGITEKVTTGCGNIYVTVNSDDQGLCEVFTTLGKAGGCASAQLQATSRLISLALRSGVDIDSIVKHLKGIRCPSIAWENGKSVLSCADAIASVLEKYTAAAKAGNGNGNGNGNGHSEDSKPKVQDYGLVKNMAGQCPECANLLVYQEGCFVCPGCGYTKC